jgi:glycosyltransferase involved in cell wall biosynthesis
MRENNLKINDDDIYMCGYGMDINIYKMCKKNSCAGDYYMYIGAVAPYKGVLDIALAFKNINERLVIVGPCTNEDERPYYNKVLEIVQECGNIEYYGEAKTEDEKIRLLQKAKGSIIASGYSSYDADYYEAFGLVMLEANAVGIPVIGFNKGNTSDYILDGINGYKFDNITELPGLIEKVNNNDMLAGSLEVSERYRISEISKKYLELFNSIRRT